MRKKKGKKSKSGGGTDFFDELEQTPVARELAIKGWPPVQFSVRMQQIIDGILPTDPDQPPPLRAIHFMQGIAGSMAARLGDDPFAENLRQQLEMFDSVMDAADMLPSAVSAGESAELHRAWELLEFAAGLLNYLQSDAQTTGDIGLAQRVVSFKVSPEEFKVMVQHGGLAPDTLAAMIPEASSGCCELHVSQAAEACFFLVVAVIGGPPEAHKSLLAVAECLGEALEAQRPPEPVEEDEPQDLKSMFMTAVFGRPKRTGRRRTAPSLTKDWYQIKIALRDVKPPIWRRIVVPDCTLATLDEYVQNAMGWSGGHLACFEIDGVSYSAPHPFTGELLEDTEDGRNYAIGQLVQQGTKKLNYCYDFGDSWEHVVAIEKIVPPDKAPGRPTCTDGARACPPEDCGGVWGYEELLEALKNPKSPDREERLEWLGGEWDPDAFSAAEVTESLS